MSAELLLAILTSLGIGSTLTAVVNRWLSRTDRRISEDTSLRAELRGDLDKTRARLDELESRNDELILENARLQGSVLVQSAQIKSLEELAARVSDDIKRIRDENASLITDVRRLELDNLRLTQELRRVTEENIRLATGIAQLHEENKNLRAALYSVTGSVPPVADAPQEPVSVTTSMALSQVRPGSGRSALGPAADARIARSQNGIQPGPQTQPQSRPVAGGAAGGAEGAGGAASAPGPKTT